MSVFVCVEFVYKHLCICNRHVWMYCMCTVCVCAESVFVGCVFIVGVEEG